jgi:hypothetical protein
MPTGPDLPSAAMLMRIAADHGLDLTAADADSYRALTAGAIESYRRLEEFSEPEPPVKYPRDGGWRPRPEDNPCNGWYWRCNIAGAPEVWLSPSAKAVTVRIGSALTHSLPSPAGLTTQVGFIRLAHEKSGPSAWQDTFYEKDGLHRNSGVPEFRITASRKSGKPDLRCQARQ